MFTRVPNETANAFISEHSEHSEHVISKVVCGFSMHRIKTKRLTITYAANNLDLLLVDNGKDKYYLLPWPKSVFSYVFWICTAIGLFGLFTFSPGVVMGVGIYIGTKLMAMPILWDINLTGK